ncbi:uncharacterized protein LOC110995995 isoform X2 [Pieris rapae]|uniref:uncharacterized protein LOC110995995 isoform X2 n=1 Tax=Pieris rapae TaxID=64459 RepID=UPI001E280507|nr:uncharacterized protein LOC110995995 isoform X2 [Pieris rapae]
MFPFSSLAIGEYKQYGPQTTPLANTNLPSNPSGDANSNQLEINLDTRNEFKEIGLGTESKATLKSDDDFDVNEYFARLQGTRYVSAPLNRKEDQNANLPVEENLEEINLNEPEKEEHSITADIAQNFSQLPTVLPQVASAVFSSFSNMLNLKREVDRPPAYQDGYGGINEINYNQYKEQEVPVSKSVPPPLTEPPLSGSSNYRITTRKKVYAQIPGLTGEAPTYNAAANPSSHYFTNTTTNQIPNTDVQKDFAQSSYYFTPEMRDPLPKTDPPHATPAKTEPIVLQEDNKAITKPVLTESTYNFFTPIQNVESSRNEVRTANETFQANTTAPIIPPPPMFSNRRDSQGSVGRTVLPPSVARRIAGNQPLIKPQASPLITYDNIFVPTFSDHSQDVSTNAPPMFYTPSNDSHAVSNPIQAAPQGLPITKETLSNENVPYSESVTTFPTISPPVTEFFIPNSEPTQETKIESNPVPEQSKVDALQNFSSSAFMQVSPQESLIESKQEQTILPPKKSFDSANPPPQFFDPSSINQPNVYNEISVSKVHHGPPKPVQEPPKMSGTVNYRMSKKRPQYYSGPIEGVGNISNNIKPTLNPVQSQFDSLQGPLFTPSQDSDISEHKSVAPAVQTDISTFSSPASTYGVPTAQPYQQDFNTAFDLSRPTTEYYEQPQTETKSFGLLGSLKSKLSSIDINKIQNTVTTFFDPAYNGEAKDDQQRLAPYQSSRMDHAQDSSTFDIFVGSSNTNQPNFNSNYPSDYNMHQYNPQEQYYDSREQQTSNYSSWPTSNPVIENNYGGINLDNTVDTNLSSANSYINTIDTPFALPSLPISIIEKPSSLQAPIFSEDTKTSNVSSVISVSNPLSFFSTRLEVTPSEILDDEIIESVTNVVLGPTPQPCEITAQENKGIEFPFQRNENTFKLFDPRPLLPYDKHVTPENTLTDIADIPSANKQPSSPSLETKSSIGNLPPTSDFSFLEPVDNDTFLKYFEPAPNTSHLFDFTNKSTDLPASKESEINLIETKVAEIALHDSHKKSIEDLAENVSELNICETCREVNKHEEKSEVEDLTSQLIENITAPIQLLNPVGVGLTVDEHVPEQSLTESATDPLDDIAQISEDFIENIPIHSVTELLEDVTLNKSLPNCGFNTADINDIIDTTTQVEHNYNLPGVSALGLFQSELSENIPRNASDEIKAGLKNSLDELVLPPLPILPTAPADDDSKSDESGLDVHSIEQDANKDFPIYEEFVIEPSETDDDKIEFMVREKSTEDLLPAVDTFTNRVARYKKMETVNDESHVNTATIPTSISPSLTMASYFDTGNYAVETYYKNSLNLRSENLSTRIPPGFEKEFSKRFPSVTSTGFVEDYATHVPDTTTQTRLTPTLTFTQTTQSDVTKISDFTTASQTVSSIETQHTKPLDEPKLDTERLPAFSSLTEHPKEIEESNKTEAKTSNELPDPKNFFSSDPGPSNKENDEYNSYNRLSSYFATPPKADNPKSFFELSQSQDHYRHATQSETHNNNMKLIHDLAMYRDVAPIEIVRTVNYFTVEYDNQSIESISDPNKSKDIETMPTDIVKKCKNCSNFNVGCVKKLQLEYANLKIKKYMDNQDQKGEIIMDLGSETHSQNVTVNLMEHSMKEDDDGIAILTENRPTSEYSPVKYYWFYRVDNDGQSTWRGFSVADSRALEIAFNSSDLNENTLVPTDGGRYDVNIIGRIRMPVYWSEKPTNVRRCSWFYCNTDGRYVPYAEAVAEKLEVEYQHGIATGEWHRRLILPNNELVVMHGPGVMVHFLQNSVDSFSGSPQSMTRPRVVKRGAVESEIEDTEPSRIDHLLLLCHGVGSACDMRMRPVEAVVDDFRKTSMQLLQSHYKNSCDSGLVGRMEVLPISWHSSLHSGETGVDKRLANVTLDSIPWLRNFTNDTVLDVLFYTSPVFGQTIIDTVCNELNRVYGLFKKRNPDFRGGVSLGGHSLGSVILYDLLGHQTPEALSPNGSTEKKYVQKCAGTGQPMFKYPKLEFCPEAMFALGSPIAIFECVRGVEMLGKDFCLPTCGKFFNIFHPYDPIAYRIEPMINPELRQIKPYLIPHHKGRKRMHLELKETMARVGADIKQKLVESIKSTWFSMWKTAPPPTDQLEKVVEEEMEKEEMNDECKEDVTQDKEATPEMLGRLNSGRRIDYVLQEAPFEMINEYLFAMTSHVCYWESADTILLILREVYASMRVQPDCCVPQNNLTVQRTRIVTTDGLIASSSDSPSTSRGSPC